MLWQIFNLPRSSVVHIPRSVRPLLAKVLSTELRNAASSLWGFVRLFLFAKVVLRLPPFRQRRRRFVLASMLMERLHVWSHSDGLYTLWKSLQDDLCVRKSTSGPQTKSNNVSRALFWAREGRHSNAVQSLTSTGAADNNDDCIFQELLERHPTSDPPSCSAPESASLVIDESAVLMYLKGFPRGTSPGASGLRAQHILDAVSGHTTSSAEDCLHALTRFMNFLLSGKASPLLAPWLCGAPLTALLKKTGGVRPIAVGEVLRRLASRLCCHFVRPFLPDVFLPHGQGGVGIPGGLEGAIHAVRHALSQLGGDESLALLKIDMKNAFNECSRTAFLSRVYKDFPEISRWVYWCYNQPVELRFGHRRILASTGVQQGDPLGPLLFSSVLLQFLGSNPVSENCLLSL